ncbi:flagellar export protein FliJ [Nitrospinota bacterium]
MAARFPLDAVLRLRRMEEEAKMKEFASFDRVYVREQNNLRELHENMHMTRQEMDERTAVGGLSSQEAQLYLSFFAALSSKIRYQEDLVHKVRIEVERKRREMGFAVRRRKIFQNLKEKHFEAEEHNERRRESLEIDEIAGIRFLARTKGESASG